MNRWINCYRQRVEHAIVTCLIYIEMSVTQPKMQPRASQQQPLSIKQPSLLCYFEGENWIWVPTPCPAPVLPKQAHANSKSKQQWSSTVPKCASFPTSRASSRGWHSGLFLWAWAKQCQDFIVRLLLIFEVLVVDHPLRSLATRSP